MKFLSIEKLGPHRYKTPEGYLICTDAIIARTGKQQYVKNELFTDSEDDETIIDVDRPYEEVFSPETIASGENKALCDEHPENEVNIDNHRDLAMGYMRDVHQGKDGDKDVLMANIIVTDPEVIAEIESGKKTELSCGYDCQIMQDDNGNYYQSKIRINHLALCEKGRAGNARIQDSINDTNVEDKKIMKGNGEVHFLYERGKVKSWTWDRNKIANNFDKWSELYNYAKSLNCKVEEDKYDYITIQTNQGNEQNLCKVWNKINSNYSVNELMNLLQDSVQDSVSNDYNELKKKLNNCNSKEEYHKWLQEVKKNEKITVEELDKLIKLYNSVKDVQDAYYGPNDNILTKDDAIKELKTAKIKDGDYWDAGQPKEGFYVQIQAPGMRTHEEITKYPRVSPKESSYAWGRIWNNGKFEKEFKGPLNVVRQDMLRYLQSIHDSIKDGHGILSSGQSFKLKKYCNRFDIDFDKAYNKVKDKFDEYQRKGYGKSVDDALEEILEDIVAGTFKDSVQDKEDIKPFTYSQILNELKIATNNFTSKDFKGSYSFENEAETALKILKSKKYNVDYHTENSKTFKGELDYIVEASKVRQFDSLHTKDSINEDDFKSLHKDSINVDDLEDKPVKVRITFDDNKEANDALNLLQKSRDFINCDLIFDDTIQVNTSKMYVDDLKKKLRMFFIKKIQVLDSIKDNYKGAQHLDEAIDVLDKYNIDYLTASYETGNIWFTSEAEAEKGKKLLNSKGFKTSDIRTKTNSRGHTSIVVELIDSIKDSQESKFQKIINVVKKVKTKDWSMKYQGHTIEEVFFSYYDDGHYAVDGNTDKQSCFNTLEEAKAYIRSLKRR